MSWHYIGTTWMSTKCQHCWNCVPLTPVTLCCHFPLVTDVSKRFIGRDCFHTHCCCRKQPFRALRRHRSESTGFHIDGFRVFHKIILIFKQTRNISIKRKFLSMPSNKYTTRVLWSISLIFTKSWLLVECKRPNVMRLMSWHLTQNVMRLALWDGKPMSWL